MISQSATTKTPMAQFAEEARIWKGENVRLRDV